MFRLDAHTHDPRNTDPRPPLPPDASSPLVTLHACRSACDEVDGRRVAASFGRKNCDATFSTDKCVSRRHCELCLEDGDDENGPPVLTARDLNSKFGTFLLREVTENEEETTEQTKRPNKNDDDDDDDDTTDDETGEIDVSKRGDVVEHEGRRYRRTKLEPEEAVALFGGEDLRRDGAHCYLQFGVSGSCVRVAPVRFSFCFSTFDKSRTPDFPTADVLRRELGADVASSWEPDVTTHLIAPHLKTSAKVLSAVAARRPVCGLDYVRALLRRSDKTLPLPDPDAHRPPKVGEGDHFLARDDDAPPPLRPYLVITLAHDEIARLCRAAGARACPAHEFSDEEFFFETDADDWVRRFEEVASATRSRLVLLESKSSRVRKRYRFLTKKRPDLPVTSAKEVAQAVTAPRGTALKDMNGNDITTTTTTTDVDETTMDVDETTMNLDETTTNVDRTEDTFDDQKIDAKRKDDGLPNVDASLDTTNGDDGGGEANDVSFSTAIHADSNSGDKTNAKIPTPTAKNSPTSSVRTVKSFGEWTTSKNSVKSSTSPSASSKKRRAPLPFGSQTSAKASASASASTSTSASPPPSKRRRRPRSDDNDATVAAKTEESANKTTTARLPRTDDGWFVAAPADPALRRAYRRDPVGGDDDGIPAEPAVTESRNDLVVARPPPPPAADQQRGRRRYKGPDYKGFRKNSVLLGPDEEDSRALYPLRAVLPKESEEERRLVSAHREAELERRAADALFADDGGGGSGSGRRGGGSIRDYMSQGSGTSRRSRKR